MMPNNEVEAPTLKPCPTCGCDGSVEGRTLPARLDVNAEILAQAIVDYLKRSADVSLGSVGFQHLVGIIEKHCAPSEVGELISKAEVNGKIGRLVSVEQIRADLARITAWPWRWGNWDTTFGEREPVKLTERNTLEHCPSLFQACAGVRRREDTAEKVLQAEDGEISIGDRYFIMHAPEYVAFLLNELETALAAIPTIQPAAVACGCRAVVENMGEKWLADALARGSRFSDKTHVANEIIAALPAPAVEGDTVPACEGKGHSAGFCFECRRYFD